MGAFFFTGEISNPNQSIEEKNGNHPRRRGKRISTAMMENLRGT